MSRKRDRQARQKTQAQKHRQQVKAVPPAGPAAAAGPAARVGGGPAGLPHDAAPSESGETFKPLLLTMAQVGQLLNVSRSTLYRMEQAGHLPGRVQIGGQVRYHLETIEQWLRGQVQGASDEQQP